MIDQQWLDKRCYSVPADVEPELNRLADDAGNLADAEHQLIEAIKEKKARLEQLPDIIRRLECQLSGVSHDLAETFEYHDKLTTAHKFLTAKQQPAEVEA